MPVEVVCPACQHRVRVPDHLAGKRVKCPKCKQPVQVRESDTDQSQQASAGQAWHVQTEDGSKYGPIDQPELDNWLTEGRISAETQLLREGSDTWQWASEIFPQLAEPEPRPSGGEKSAASRAPAFKLAPGDSSGGQGPRYSRREYPAMQFASKLYRVLGWIVMALGGLGIVVYLIGGVIAAFSARGIMAKAMAVGLTLGIVIGLTIYVAFAVVTLWFLSEAIRVMLDIEDSTHRSSLYLQRLQPGDQE